MRSMIRRALLAAFLSTLAVLCAGAQSIGVNDAGTWRTPTEIYVNDAGTWRQIQEIYVNDAGTWRLVFSGATVAVADQSWTDTAVSPANAGVDFSLESDGDIAVAETDDTGGVAVDQGDWLSPKTGMANFDVRCTIVSGTLTSGTCDGATWENLGTTRTWRRVRITDVAGVDTVVMTLEIRRTSTGATVDTATVTIAADVDP
jgi:hypothetical protein